MKLYFGFLLFGVALTIALAEVLSRAIERDREQRLHDEMKRVEWEAEETADRRWHLYDGDVLNKADTRWTNASE